MADSFNLRTAYDQLLDLIFPPRCPGCRGVGMALCAACTARCRHLRHEPRDGVAHNPPNALLRTSTALYQYDAPLREAIHMFKYRRRRALAGPLGALIADALPRYLGECEVIVPVPLHSARLRERGFNQSALLAAALGVAMGKPVHQTLSRTRSTAHQVGMDRAARESNVRGAFAWQGSTTPQSVLLLDDVLTTGSTMRECARALRAAGVREVHALALAGEWGQCVSSQ